MFVSRTVKRLFLSLLVGGLLWTPALAEAPVQPGLAELWVQTSAEYRGLCHQTYNLAWMQFQNWEPLLEKRDDGKAYLAGSDKPVAIILDLDETVVDNSGFQAYTSSTGAKYSPALWDAWVEFQGMNEGAGRVLPGSARFLNRVEELGVTPIFISNRNVGHESATAKVLERNGINIEDIESRMLLKLSTDEEESERGRRWAAEQDLEMSSEEARILTEGEGLKETRRQMIQEKYDVVAYFGDVLGDFEPFLEMADETKRVFEQRQEVAEEHKDMWGSTWFILPNPMYGSWHIRKEAPGALNDFGFSVYLGGRRAP